MTFCGSGDQAVHLLHSSRCSAGEKVVTSLCMLGEGVGLGLGVRSGIMCYAS